uniref:Putative secreted peptide n=1 Tax=Anopheles braziliensis TaxID=58242 RepID=A0A2M3ZNG0_9DIPT
MHDKIVLLVVGVFCALTCLQVARTDLAGDYEIDYDEDEGFWIGHGLGNRKEGVCFPFPSPTPDSTVFCPCTTLTAPNA